MTRRDANWLIAKAGASVAGQAFLSSWLASAHEMNEGAPAEPDRWINYKPQFFSPEEFAILDRFTALLIPTDETPGAREAHVAQFIDFIVFSSREYSPETQVEWRKAMDWLRTRHFDEQLMGKMSEPEHEGHHVFQTMKQLAVYGFYTSRIGLIENLEYKGVSYYTSFPACTHPEHRNV
jgi:hypothetical protein